MNVIRKVSKSFKTTSRWMQRTKEGYAEAKKNGEKVPALPWVLFDAARAHARYGATTDEYFQFRFWNKSPEQRSRFMTYPLNQDFYAKVNDPDWIRINHKAIFNDHFRPLLKRNWIGIPYRSKEAFVEFVQKNSPVFIKGCQAGWGQGIRKVDEKDPEKLAKLYDELIEDGGPYREGFVVEAAIEQSPVTASLHPQSVNTARIVTFFNGTDVRVVAAVLRCGCGDAFIDNHASGGYTAKIDPETGKVVSLASGRGKINIEKHPDTGVAFLGFQYPDWDQAISLVKEAAKTLDNIHYIGWDVAFLKEGGVCLVEGNPTADTDLLQEPTQVGVRPLYEEMLAELGKTLK